MEQKKSLEQRLKEKKGESSEVLRKRIEELEAKVRELKGKNSESTTRTSMPKKEGEIYNNVVKIYSRYKNRSFHFEDLYIHKLNIKEDLDVIQGIDKLILQRMTDYILSDTDLIISPNLSGVFLTNLIELSDLNEIHLKFSQGEKIQFFGYNLSKEKKIIIQGDIGAYCGREMKKGEIIINSDAKDYCGFKTEGGYLKIFGDTGDYLGKEQRGGRIEVKGDVDSFCGQNMANAIIIIGGNAGYGCGENMFDSSIDIGGSVGNYCGKNMRGKIRIGKDAGDYCGYGLKSGKITVEGNAGKYCGENMTGGNIIVKGEVGLNVGYNMQSGSIKLYGYNKPEFRDSTIKGGIIYHNDRILISK